MFKFSYNIDYGSCISKTFAITIMVILSRIGFPLPGLIFEVAAPGDSHLQGVAIAISSQLQPSVVEVSPVDERIMALRLKHAFGFVSFIAVYAPTNVCKLNVKEAFYAKLTSMVDKCPQRDIRIVLGDSNAVSGCDRASYEMSIESHGSGAGLGSENSLLVCDFAMFQRMRISGSWYQRSNPHRWTWFSDTIIVAKEIDHIIASTRWGILQNCRENTYGFSAENSGKQGYQ
ncbi:craniofacial development protein 2-like [Penaeus vannamei]|uniref:craniofacial development protein 2-like n=1 Tax=Penaeus vannamei TaxID=6689 RepID=UPI00387F3C13